MSRKKAPVIFGPDGRPIDKDALRRKAEPQPTSVTLEDGTDLSEDVKSVSINFSHSLVDSLYARYFAFGAPEAAAEPRTLADAVGDEIAALTADFDGETVPELPAPVRDLDTYHGAFASAAANCLHENAVEMLYGREWTCDDCGRSINRAEMKRAREQRSSGSSYFRYFFGG